MTRAAPLVLLATLVVYPLGTLSAQAPDKGRLTAARQVLDASGTVDIMVQALKAAIPAQRLANPSIPAEFWTRFEARLMQDLPQLVDSIAVLYASRFTQQELQGLLAFHRSPLGQRVRTLQPTLVSESTAMGQRWGARIGAEIGASLAAPR
jgi:uncharacterized protein